MYVCVYAYICVCVGACVHVCVSQIVVVKRATTSRKLVKVSSNIVKPKSKSRALVQSAVASFIINRAYHRGDHHYFLIPYLNVKTQ